MLFRSIGYLFLALVVIIQSCSAHKIIVGDGAAWLGRDLHDTKGLNDHDFGLALYDPVEGKWIFQRNADKYYTPASNTKILTLYTSLHYLQDSTEALRYVTRGDTMIFWGTGDPSFLYRDWKSENVTKFLKSHEGPLYYAPRQAIDKFGSGWAWDDYPYRYQVEKSSLPVYGNRITFSRLSRQLEGQVSPDYFRQFVIEDPDQKSFVERLPEANSFKINRAMISTTPFEKEIPFVVTSYDIAAILSDLLGRNVGLDYGFRDRELGLTINGAPLDSLYQLMMQESDNFIAEQLLLLCANEMNEEFSTEHVIASAQEEFFSDAPSEFQWFDGSGLSRYNLFTPQSIVWVLDNLLKEKGLDYIKSIFAAGGDNGTIEDWYGGPQGSYVFAKTGTLRNRHCLSGYLVAKSGKTLIFSFMNQNYIGSSAPVKEGMQEILKSIYKKY